MGVCRAVDMRSQSVDRRINRKLDQLNLLTGLLELSTTMVFWTNLNSFLISFLIRFQSCWFSFLRKFSGYILRGVASLFVIRIDNLYWRVLGLICLNSTAYCVILYLDQF